MRLILVCVQINSESSTFIWYCYYAAHGGSNFYVWIKAMFVTVQLKAVFSTVTKCGATVTLTFIHDPLGIMDSSVTL